MVACYLIALLLIFLNTRANNGDFATPSYIIVFGAIAILFGLAAFITSLISIFKDKERALLIYFAADLDLLVFFLLIDEFTFPH